MANIGKTPVFAIKGKKRKEWRDVDTAAADLGYAPGSIYNALTKGYAVDGWTFDYAITDARHITKILSRPREIKQRERAQFIKYKQQTTTKK